MCHTVRLNATCECHHDYNDMYNLPFLANEDPISQTGGLMLSTMLRFKSQPGGCMEVPSSYIYLITPSTVYGVFNQFLH